MRETNLETVYDCVNRCWETLCPVKFTIDGVDVWDDRFYELPIDDPGDALKDVNKRLLKNERWKSYAVVKMHAKTVCDHHTVITIQTRHIEA